MGNPEQRCSKDGNGSGFFISNVLSKCLKISKTTDKDFFLMYTRSYNDDE